FEELGSAFTLLAFGVDDAAAASFAQTGKTLGVPLKIVRDSYEARRRDYNAKFILVRPDRYIAWRADAPPADAAAVLNKAIARKPHLLPPTADPTRSVARERNIPRAH